MTLRTVFVLAGLLLGVLLVWWLYSLFERSELVAEDTVEVVAIEGVPSTITVPTTTTTTAPPTTTTTARARTAPIVHAASASRPAPAVAGSSVWDRLASCESGGNWHINTGNGYSGGLQMDAQFWRSYGGPQFASAAYLASREQQIVVAERARDSGRGYHPWPTCARRLGLI